MKCLIFVLGLLLLTQAAFGFQRKTAHQIQALTEERHLVAERQFMDHTLQTRVEEVVRTHAALPKPYVFIFVDAGSGGSRPKLFLVEDNHVVTEIKECAEIQPPLAQWAATTVEMTRFVTLVRNAIKALHTAVAPNGDHQWDLNGGAPAAAANFLKTKAAADADNWSIFIQATAGMRTISQTKASSIWAELNKIAGVKGATVSGRWEGFYGLYNAVTKGGVLPGGWDKDNIVYVEFGGASIQVAFTVADNKYNAVKSIFTPPTTFLEEEGEGEEQPVFLEIGGPMHLQGLGNAYLPFKKFFTQSFLGNAGDRMHARAVAVCKANSPGACPCLATGVKLVNRANAGIDATYDADVALSDTCFAKVAGHDDWHMFQKSCKDYNIPANLVSLTNVQEIVGAANFDQCYTIVNGIHENDKDEMPKKIDFKSQFTHLKSALDAANPATARTKTHVIVNSGGLFFSPKAAACKNAVKNFNDFKGCLEAATGYDILGAPLPGDAATFGKQRARTHNVPSMHALVKDVLVRTGVYTADYDFKVISESWLPASSKITSVALDMDESATKALYEGADVFNADYEDRELDDSQLTGFWNAVKKYASWLSYWWNGK